MLKITITLYEGVSEVKAKEIMRSIDKNYDSVDCVLLERSDNSDYTKCKHAKSCKYHNSVLLPVIADKTM